MKETIITRGMPVQFLCDIVQGKRVRVGPQAGPGPAKFEYPTLADRLRAAQILAAKVVPDLRAQEITGRDGEPLMPAMEGHGDPRKEAARYVAFALSRGLHSDPGKIAHEPPATHPSPVAQVSRDAVWAPPVETAPQVVPPAANDEPAPPGAQILPQVDGSFRVVRTRDNITLATVRNREAALGEARHFHAKGAL